MADRGFQESTESGKDGVGGGVGVGVRPNDTNAVYILNEDEQRESVPEDGRIQFLVPTSFLHKKSRQDRNARKH